MASGRGSSSLSTPGGIGGAGAGGLGEGGAHSDYQDNRVLVRFLTLSCCLNISYPILSQVLARDEYKCTITGSTLGSDSTCRSGPTASGALLDVVPIIPPSVDIRTLSRYAGLSGGDPLSEPTPRFFRLENLLTLDDDASDAFRSLNVWLEETVRYRIIPRSILTFSYPIPLPLIFHIVSFPHLFFAVPFSVGRFAQMRSRLTAT